MAIKWSDSKNNFIPRIQNPKTYVHTKFHKNRMYGSENITVYVHTHTLIHMDIFYKYLIRTPKISKHVFTKFE